VPKNVRIAEMNRRYTHIDSWIGGKDLDAGESRLERVPHQEAAFVNSYVAAR